METMAFTQHKTLFDRLEKVASYATLSEDERMAYDADLKAYRDMVGQLEYAEARGEAKGREEGRKEGEAIGQAKMIKEMARQGISLNVISNIAKLTIDKVKHILDSKD